MQLTFLGGADEVGASSTLIEIAGKRILVDAGIRISPRSNRGIRNDQLPDLRPISESGGPDVILLTHAHTDHTGALPLVVEQYPHVPVLATRPTQVLTRILQNDAQRIMKSKQEEEGELPIFDEVASARLMDAFETVEYKQAIKLGEALQVTYYPAGHIAGAAMLVFESEEGTLVMSGDVSMNDQRAVVSAEIPKIKSDVLVLESTYGGKLHANRDAEEKRLIESLKAVTERGGRALIPAFALGRAQEVIQIILAYRDMLDVPVYIDGMVRSVCEGYQGFSDLLPKNTVRAAKDKHLFFRDKIKPVTSRVMRENIAATAEPCVIVASSGMLTGGASVAYAHALAPHPANAIFLTGYQDEEAPGRRLQEMLRARSEGDEASIKIDGKPVTVRCEIGTYSLSAHADEMELVNMAETLAPDTTLLVHGDDGARHSLASALRQRARRVLTPKIGQVHPFNFPKRPWALGKVKSGQATGELDPEKLWEAVKNNVNSIYSARELAQMWWGDAERAEEAITALTDSVYFAQDWRRKDQFRVKSKGQVNRSKRQREIMMQNPDIVGKLIGLRDSNDRPRFGVVVNAEVDQFTAEVADVKGRNYPGDALLWVIGHWEGYERGKGIKGQVGTMLNKARQFKDTLMPLTKRQKLVAKGEPVTPESLLPDPLPDGVNEQVALMAIILALAGDGAMLQNGGLVPSRAREGEPLEQNQARDVAYGLFPPEARLRKVGMDIHRTRLNLDFDFPDYVQREYAELLDDLADQTGWNIHIKPGVNQQALSDAIFELMPEGASIRKGPSFYMDRREVGLELDGAEDMTALRKAFLDLTGFRLVTGSNPSPDNASSGIEVMPEDTDDQMEINEAYGVIRDALNPLGLYKVGLKQGTIVLTFISPQVGERHQDIIASLADETGYPLTVHPHPNQQQILQIANQLLRGAGWDVRKGPGIHVDRGAVSISMMQEPDDGEYEELNEQFEEQTGYVIDITVQGGQPT